MPNTLTRDEARERARLLEVRSYRVHLDVTHGEPTFTSVTTVDFGCRSPGASTFIDLAATAVEEVTLNGVPLPAGSFDGRRITLTGLAADNELRVSAQCAYSRSGEGLHRFTDPADGAVYLYSDLETFDAHRLYACFDQPDLKATFELAMTVPRGWEVVSNEAPDVTGEAVAGGELWHFPPTPVLPTYITAVVAGPYYVVRDSFEDIPLGLYCRQSLARYLDPDELFEVTRQGFGFFHEAFDLRYPFGKYDQVFVPEFKAGAMENAGCVTFLEDYVFRSRVTDFARQNRASTILHEMAHMWFGDLVTMRWWDDLWLNESFATWAATLAQAEATRWRDAWTEFAQVQKAWAYRQDQLPTTHPISAEVPDIATVEVNFDGITYAKGAAVIKQLVAYVGMDNFLTGVRTYFRRHAWGNATLADLLAPLEEASGRDLSGWAKQWLQSAGVNTLRPDIQVGPDGRFAEFAVRQEATASHPMLRDHRIAIGLYNRTSEGLVRQQRVECDVTGELTVVNELAGAPSPDLVLINDEDLTYAKVRLDPRSLATLHTSIGEFTDSLPAALCWGATWDMCRDAELAAREYLRLVITGVSSVTSIAMTQTLLRQAGAALSRYTDPAWRQAGSEYAAREFRGLLARAEPGSDEQLAYAQALIGVASTPADVAFLAALRDGSAVVDGLVIDTDLRWSVLRRLVSAGVAGEAEIAAEAAQDATDAGARRAAGCRAAIPDAAAKEAAWDLIMSGSVSGAMFRAVLSGFADPNHLDLLEPFQQRYFDSVCRVWQEWSMDTAQYFATYAYPLAVSPSVVQATDDLIARADPPDALRRLLLEGRDGVQRAMRCQECDRQAGSRETAS
ncbi:MAG TPA: aminopeptidase N [Streptosporangiaceae bacterium]|nr:aminopeptidase N [Streptosporangiaceae bacterium]